MNETAGCAFINMKTQPVQTSKIRFACVLYHADFVANVPWFSVVRVCVYFCRLPWTQTLEWFKIFVWNLDAVNKTFLETFWHTQIWNQGTSFTPKFRESGRNTPTL